MILSALMHTFVAKVFQNLWNLRHTRSDTQQRKNTHIPKPQEFNDFVVLEPKILIKMNEKPNEFHSFNIKPSKPNGKQLFC